MRRSMLSALLLLAVCSVALVSGTPFQPDDWTPIGTTEGKAEPMCLLDALAFTNGLKLIGQFYPNVFHYQCSCANFAAPYTTSVVPHLMDPGSSAEVTFNGAKINFKSTNNAISNGGTDGVAPNSPKTQSDPLAFIVGDNTIEIGVSCNGLGDPNPCYYKYTISCYRPATVVGDPQFVGLRGQNYQVHGVSGEVYNIVSDADLQYNSRFVFLDSGDCPIIDGKKQKGCFSHPGSYLGELGLKTRAGDRIQIVSGDAKTGFAAITINNKPLSEGETVMLADNLGFVAYNHTHATTVEVGDWQFVFENSDKYINQRVSVQKLSGLRSHGLLGQTWRTKTYPNAVKHIEGQVDDYVVRGNDLFGDDFIFNAHN